MTCGSDIRGTPRLTIRLLNGRVRPDKYIAYLFSRHKSSLGPYHINKTTYRFQALPQLSLFHFAQLLSSAFKQFRLLQLRLSWRVPLPTQALFIPPSGAGLSCLLTLLTSFHAFHALFMNALYVLAHCLRASRLRWLSPAAKRIPYV